MYPKVIINSSKAVNVVYRHPWIFSGAIESVDKEVQHGSLVSLEDPNGRVLGVGTFSATSSIAVRILDFSAREINKKWFCERLIKANERRALLRLGPNFSTTGYRVVFGESDGLSGLIIDRFSNVLVIQIATAGMDNLRAEIVAAIQEVFQPQAIFERSDMSTRREEKLGDEVGWRFGEAIDKVEFKENDLKFLADIPNGQKTGFFLDQRDTRTVIKEMANNRRVLNLFSYTGAAAVAALSGEAKEVLNVDASSSALALIKEQVKLNKLPNKKCLIEEADIFQWLNNHNDPEYNMVVLDPPALIKSQRDSEEGKKAYHFLNRAAMRLVKDGGIFITSSCSHYLTEDDLIFTLRRASVQNNLRFSLLRIIKQSPDHPLSVYFPEAEYLKTFVGVINQKE